MPFMEPDIQFMAMWHGETDNGMDLVPADLVQERPTVANLADYCEGTPLQASSSPSDPDAEKHVGWYSRLSAPGYMDCTDWGGPAVTEHAAQLELADRFDICSKCWDACWDGSIGCTEDT